LPGPTKLSAILAQCQATNDENDTNDANAINDANDMKYANATNAEKALIGVDARRRQ
jgi:hypothetical protein